MGNYSGKDITGDGFAFEPSGDFLSSGATKSSTAIANAVNGAITYVKTLTFEAPETNPDGDGGDNGEGGNS